MKIEITNCCECPFVRQEHDSDPGLDGNTKLFCTQTGNFLGERKTRWVALGRSYIDIPSDCPYNNPNSDEEDEN